MSKHISKIERGDSVELFGQYRKVQSISEFTRGNYVVYFEGHPRPLYLAGHTTFAFVQDKPVEFPTGAVVVDTSDDRYPYVRDTYGRWHDRTGTISILTDALIRAGISAGTYRLVNPAQ